MQKVKKISISKIIKNGEEQYRTEKDKVDYFNFVNQNLKSCVDVLVTYELKTKEEVLLDNARSSYFAYLRQIIIDGHESFSESIPGLHTKDKVEVLDNTLRKRYCENYPEYYEKNTFYLPGDKEKKTRLDLFSVSRDSKLNFEQLLKYYTWAKDIVMNLHLDHTKQFGEPWTINYWLSEEA